MTAPGLAELFVRWRRDGDLRALSEVVDETAPLLQRLARRLMGNENDADDIVQSTFLAALDDADRFDAESPLAPWLLGILLRRVKAERRRRNAALDPDRIAVPGASDPVQEALNDELSTAVERAIAALPQHYAEVLRPKVLDDLRSVEIAQSLGRSPSVVRTQVRRALQLLRRALPVGFGASVAAVVLPSSSLAQIKRSVLAHGARGTTPWITTGLMMHTKGLAGLALLAAALGSLLLYESDASTLRPANTVLESSRVLTKSFEIEEEVALVAPDENETAGPIAKKRRSEDASREDDVDSFSTSPKPDPVDNSWVLAGRVFGPTRVDHDTSPARGTKVRISGPGIAMEFGVVSNDGTFRERMQAGRPWEIAVSEVDPKDRAVRVVAKHPRYLPAVIELDATSQRTSDGYYVELFLREAAHVAGSVVVPSGNSKVVDIALYQEVGGAPVGLPVATGQTNRRGEYNLKTEYAGSALLVASRRGLRPTTTSLETFLGVDVALPEIVLENGYRLNGEVSLAPEVPLAQADRSVRLSIAGEQTKSELVWIGSTFEWPEVNARFDNQGAFTIDGLAPMRYEIFVQGRDPVEVNLRDTDRVTVP